MKTCKRKKSYPKWAKYKATDPNGDVYVYEHQPACREYSTNYSGYWEDQVEEQSSKYGNRYIKTKCAISICKARKSLRLIED